MLKTFIASIIFLAATAFPVNGQQGPGCDRYDNCHRGRGGTASYGQICTNNRNGSLNVRTGPGRNDPSRAQIPNGRTVSLFDSAMGHDGEGYRWQYIDQNGVQGWVRYDYVCE